MKLFTTKQIAELDKYTIINEPVSDIDLMERASLQITGWLVKKISTERRLLFFVGPGNNGGDALAIARQMADLDYLSSVFLLDLGKELNGSPLINFHRLEKQKRVEVKRIKSIQDFPNVRKSDIIIDGLFGSGLTRPLEGFVAEIVKTINHLQNKVVAIDIPSGLMGEDNSKNNPENIIKADFTLTFQFPKISFLFAENEKFTGKTEVLPIGLHPKGIEELSSDFYLLTKENISELLMERPRFSHKGTFGHALLIAGSVGKMGASVLASKACLRAGAGLLTTHIPHQGCQIIQTAVPEAMVNIDQHDYAFTEFPGLEQFSVVGVGPGIGLNKNTQKAFGELLEKTEKPLVIDADGINILSNNTEWIGRIPEGSVLTPHPGEFKRLVGETSNSYHNIQKQIEFSKSNKVFVVLKGAFTSISTPEGKVFFNSTGNPGMATAGSGDVLTGVILGILSQGYSPEDAAKIGVFMHGLAGDLAVKKKSEVALIASDIIDFLGEAFLTVNTKSE